MKKKFRRIFAAIAALTAILILSACGAKDETPIPADAAASAAPEGTAAPDAEATPAAYGANASARVTATAAYSYADGDKTKLYAAVEYQNDGDCPIAVSNVKLTIAAAGVNETAEFVPELSDYIVLLPGETGYIARWLGETTIPAGETITLDASLTAQKRDERGARITVDNLYIADNYPSVTTLSGRLTCQEGRACAANMIFAGFYDENGRFIGAWYFSKNALFEGGDSKNFVVDMNDFPIAKLSEKAADVRGIGFGFDF